MKKLLFTMYSTALWVTVISYGAIANAQPVSNPTVVIPNYNVETIEPILAEMGVSYQRRTATDGSSYLTASYEGINFSLFPAACESGSCRGMNLNANFPKNTLANVNAFNSRYAAGKAVVGDPDTILGRYLIGDYGAVRGSVAIDIIVFVNSAKNYQQGEYLQAVSASLNQEQTESDDEGVKIANALAPPADVAVGLGAMHLLNVSSDLASQDPEELEKLLNKVNY